MKRDAAFETQSGQYSQIRQGCGFPVQRTGAGETLDGCTPRLCMLWRFAHKGLKRIAD
jgi:hypothetical protein